MVGMSDSVITADEQCMLPYALYALPFPPEIHCPVSIICVILDVFGMSRHLDEIAGKLDQIRVVEPSLGAEAHDDCVDSRRRLESFYDPVFCSGVKEAFVMHGM